MSRCAIHFHAPEARNGATAGWVVARGTGKGPIQLQAGAACSSAGGLEEAVQEASMVQEASIMMRKGQVLGITRDNLLGHAWVFGAPLGIR